MQKITLINSCPTILSYWLYRRTFLNLHCKALLATQPLNLHNPAHTEEQWVPNMLKSPLRNKGDTLTLGFISRSKMSWPRPCLCLWVNKRSLVLSGLNKRQICFLRLSYYVSNPYMEGFILGFWDLGSRLEGNISFVRNMYCEWCQSLQITYEYRLSKHLANNRRMWLLRTIPYFTLNERD